MPPQLVESRNRSNLPNALLWLVPRNVPALKCFKDNENQFYVGKVRHCGEQAFAITLERTSTVMPGSLLTLGRNGDIVIRGDPSISSGLICAPRHRQSTDLSRRIHCQILLNSKTREIIVRDKSSTCSTEIISMPEKLPYSVLCRALWALC